MKNFDTLGVMIDLSRNAVMTVSELKKYISLLAKMGYNQVQLYTEDTYEVEGEPYFGYFRGRYTQKELKELDDYAYGLGVELVPCIQTLAHFSSLLRWPGYRQIADGGDMLLVGEEATYQFIERLISSLRKCFRTKKIHIGMDEAGNVGKGRYQQIHGERDRTVVFCEHLAKVCEITKKYDFEPMIWSDMFYRLANNGEYYSLNTNFPDYVAKMVPKDVTLVYWDYYHTDKKSYRAMIKGHKKLTDKLFFAGGAWKWAGFAPHNDFAIRTIKASLDVCMEEGIRDVMITLWGDGGAEASNYAVLPSLCYAACLAQGITHKDEIKAKFRQWVGCEFDDFMLLDLPDRSVPTKEVIDTNGWKLFNPSKYQLYSDCFMGIFDTAVKPTESKKYASYARKLKNAAKRCGEYAYLFDALSKLCAVLSYKVDIGIRARAMYKDENHAGLDELIADYKKMIKQTEQFYSAFRTQWYRENKPYGFEIQDSRLGGLIMRMRNCLERLVAFRNGEITSIPELEEEVLPMFTEKTCFNYWVRIISTNATY